MSKLLQELKAVGVKPDIQIYKIGPEVIEAFVAKLIILMGGNPKDIQTIVVGNDKKKLKVAALLETDSKIFRPDEPEKPLALLGRPSDDIQISSMAINTLASLGFVYTSDEHEKEVQLYKVTEYKKNVEIELSADVVMAIITDSNYCDEFFAVDAVEEVVRKKKHDKKKFKGKKKTVVFAKVQCSFHTDGGYSPDQVSRWNNGPVEVEDLDDDNDGDDD